MSEKNNELTLDNAPLGTRAPSINGGHWERVERGWKWCTGATFPRPGGDWNEKLIPPTPASSAPGGEAVRPVAPNAGDLSDEQIDAIYNAQYAKYGQVCDAEDFRMFARVMLATHLAAAPNSAQQGEDEPQNVGAAPTLCGSGDEPKLPSTWHWVAEEEGVETVEYHHGSQAPSYAVDVWKPLFTAGQTLDYARTYHAHMMRKLGDGEYRKRIEEYAVRCGWNPDSDEGAIEYVSRASYERGAEDTKLAQAGAERAVPEGFEWPKPPVRKGQSSVLFDDGYEERWAKAIEAVRSALAAAPSPAAAKEGGAA